MEQPDSAKRPPGAPAIYHQTFPVIPPSPFRLTDDLFTALHLRPLFDEHVGKPEPIKQEGGKEEESQGDGGVRPSTPTSAPTKREWIKPKKEYEVLLGGLPGTCQTSVPDRATQLTNPSVLKIHDHSEGTPSCSSCRCLGSGPLLQRSPILPALSGKTSTVKPFDSHRSWIRNR
jgi:hypothetical protein